MVQEAKLPEERNEVEDDLLDEVNKLVESEEETENDELLYRLGGTHGKLWRVMKEAGYTLYQMGEQEKKVTTDRVMKAVQIKPQWVPLKIEDGAEIEMDELPQMLSGRSNSMIQMYFDVIPKCKAEVKMTYPENYEDLIERYLELSQTLNFGNKRRGTIEILNKHEIN